MLRWARNVPLPEPHLIAFGLGVIAGFLAGWTLPLPPLLRLAGLLLVVIGLTFAVWATWVSAETHMRDPDRLVTRGPYAVSRNPMYVGWTVLYIGIAVALANAWLFVFLPGVLIFTHITVRHEETRLRARFGSAYTSYCATVRRYI